MQFSKRFNPILSENDRYKIVVLSWSCCKHFLGERLSYNFCVPPSLKVVFSQKFDMNNRCFELKL